MRAQRIMTSCDVGARQRAEALCFTPEVCLTWSVTNIACPMCSAPVTLGGGMAMTNGSPSPLGLK